MRCFCKYNVINKPHAFCVGLIALLCAGLEIAMSWKASTLKNAYEHNRKDNFNGNGNESNWKKERPDLTYEDYWIFVCLVGHEDYHRYRDAHYADIEIMST